MNYRTIQSTGGSSYSLVLPKRWVDLNRLVNKDRVYFEYNQNSLIIRPENKPVDKKSINITGLGLSELWREIIALYLIGYDEITLHSEQIEKETRTAIREVIQRLAGVEIGLETKKQIVLKYIYNPEEFSYQKSINLMFEMAINMLSDGFDSYLHNDKKLARDIMDRDKAMNKFSFHVRRNFNCLLMGKAPKKSRYNSLLEIKYFEFIAIQLERIADHAVQIAAVTAFQEKKAETDIHVLSEEFSVEIIPYLSEIKIAVMKIDKKHAHRIINELEKKEKEIYKLWANLLRRNLAETMVILGSLDRLKGYIANIAERVISQYYLTEQT